MFGYVIANDNDLTTEDRARYRAVYCGLCDALSRRGPAARLALSYDMAFIVLLLDSLYEPEHRDVCARCVMHPIKPCERCESEFTDYSADMNIALAYHKCLDDWRDDRNPFRLAEAKLIRKEYDSVRVRRAPQCAAIEESMNALRALEEADAGPDEAADCFGGLMAAIFAPREDIWSDKLRAAGAALGRFIYMMDAWEDCDADIRRGRYNPLKPRRARPDFDEECKALLTMLMADFSRGFEKLPLVEDIVLMRNIVYSGVWSRYEMKLARERAREKNGKGDA